MITPVWSRRTATCRAQKHLRLGDVTFTVSPVGAAHSDGDLTLYVEPDNVLFSGDIIFEGRVPFHGRRQFRSLARGAGAYGETASWLRWYPGTARRPGTPTSRSVLCGVTWPSCAKRWAPQWLTLSPLTRPMTQHRLVGLRALAGVRGSQPPQRLPGVPVDGGRVTGRVRPYAVAIPRR